MAVVGEEAECQYPARDFSKRFGVDGRAVERGADADRLVLVSYLHPGPY